MVPGPRAIPTSAPGALAEQVCFTTSGTRNIGAIPPTRPESDTSRRRDPSPIAMPELTIDEAFQLALVHHRAGRMTDAEPIYQQILKLQPGHTDSMHLLGLVHLHFGRTPEALNFIQKAIGLRSDLAIYHNSLGQALESLGQPAEADAACRAALQLDPNYVEAHSNLGNMLARQYRYGPAIASYLTALRLNPNYAAAHNNLGNAYTESGELDQALASYRRAVELSPDAPYFHSNLLLAMHYHPGIGVAELAAEHARWAARQAKPLRASLRPHPNPRQPDRKLRIGYVSPDFRDHAVARFFLPLLRHHQRESLEIYAYAAVPHPDAVTESIKELVDGWRPIEALTDSQAAELIRQDQVDLLVDLAGHTGSNRILIFAHKPAPVQVTWLGYPDTTGLDTVDYRLTDARADPPGLSDQWNREQLFRLPRCAWCFEPGDSPPPASPAPSRPLTFGSFNNFAKISSTALRLWTQILLATPGSHLLLKTSRRLSDEVQDRLRANFHAAGVDPRRIIIRGREKDRGDHLSLFHQVDIVLDSFPYHGTTTTCEALWMGRPVVCLVGQTHVSRVGLSLLTNAGLPELAACDEAEYVRIAVALAHDRPRLASLHATLRAQLEASPLMDAPRFARDLETAFRSMWHTWCQSVAG